MSTTSKRKSFNLYQGIKELPIYNWEKIVGGEVQYLIIEEKDREKKINPIRLMETYDKCADEYFEAAEIDIINDELFITTQKLIEYRTRYIAGDKSAINFVKAYEEQIRAIKQREGKADFVKNRMALQKWFGQPIDTKKTTVYEFIQISKLAQESAKDGKSNEG